MNFFEPTYRFNDWWFNHFGPGGLYVAIAFGSLLTALIYDAVRLRKRVPWRLLWSQLGRGVQWLRVTARHRVA